MRGGGWLLDLLFLGLAGATLIGWMYFWLLCITSGARLLKPLFGEAATAITAIGFPFAFFGLLYVLILAFGREAGTWFFVTLGAALPGIGVWSIKSGKWG